MLIPPSEYSPEVGALWREFLPAQTNIFGMTAFGDLLLERPGSVVLLSLSWLSFLDIGTVVEEVQWQLEAPSERGAEWAYPALALSLPVRQLKQAYHFIHPLGLGGKPVQSNVTQLSIEQAHIGARKLWTQVNAA